MLGYITKNSEYETSGRVLTLYILWQGPTWHTPCKTALLTKRNTWTDSIEYSDALLNDSIIKNETLRIMTQSTAIRDETSLQIPEKFRNVDHSRLHVTMRRLQGDMIQVFEYLNMFCNVY